MVETISRCANSSVPTSVSKCSSDIQGMQLFSLPIFEKAPKHGTAVADVHNHSALGKAENEPYYIIKVLCYLPAAIADKGIEEKE